MQSNKTHEQQMRIIEKRVNTANAGPDFDIETDLKRSDAAKRAFQKGENLELGPDVTENRGMIRGGNQESAHHKGSGKPD
ncbi:MAG: hypothetical protein JWL86_2675 [Rhizobium sp.]|nr:hypothetical protein [Rhizobium sp.]